VKKNPNIDTCTGELFPVNSELQGKTWEQVKPFMSYMRYRQLIKKVKYTIEIEYYEEEL